MGLAGAVGFENSGKLMSDDILVTVCAVVKS